MPRRAHGRLPRPVVKALLACGIAYPVGYVVANDVVAASFYPGYCRRDQAVSELSARGAPTRRLLTTLLPPFTALGTGFGLGVWSVAGGRPALRATGGALVASGVTTIAWLPFPMSPRGDIASGAAGRSDLGHLVLSGLTVAEILALFGSGAAAYGNGFRAYSALSAATVLTSGALTSRQAARLAKGQPTPRMGLYERVSIGTWLLWMAVLAVRLLREQDPPGTMGP
ncbi:MAG TPA: DUF998 domain-containing protein [Marmoricola sp.]|nr:DUF998 domain-containing protein [Marmoricola sp.]